MSNRPLGNNQLRLLFALANPGMILVVADDRPSQSLLKRGLTKPLDRKRPDRAHRITPAGLRALADALESGRLKQFMRRDFPRKRNREGKGESS